MKSPVGILHLLANDNCLLSVSLDTEWKMQNLKIKNFIRQKNKILNKAQQQLQEYFSHKRIKFDLPLQLEGTEFQLRAWRALNKIPYGKTISYSEQAKMIQKPKAVRAIGRTNGKNPFCIVIPCHRVIGKSGNLTGYAGGVEIKKYLLELEQSQSK